MRILKTTLTLFVCFLVYSTAFGAANPAPATAPAERPWGGGGPYKLVAADFTGDGILDLAVGYVETGLVSILQGDGKGNFKQIDLIDAAGADPTHPKEV